MLHFEKVSTIPDFSGGGWVPKAKQRRKILKSVLTPRMKKLRAMEKRAEMVRISRIKEIASEREKHKRKMENQFIPEFPFSTEEQRQYYRAIQVAPEKRTKHQRKIIKEIQRSNPQILEHIREITNLFPWKDAEGRENLDKMIKKYYGKKRTKEQIKSKAKKYNIDLTDISPENAKEYIKALKQAKKRTMIDTELTKQIQDHREEIKQLSQRERERRKSTIIDEAYNRMKPEINTDGILMYQGLIYDPRSTQRKKLKAWKKPTRAVIADIKDWTRNHPDLFGTTTEHMERQLAKEAREKAEEYAEQKFKEIEREETAEPHSAREAEEEAKREEASARIARAWRERKAKKQEEEKRRLEARHKMPVEEEEEGEIDENEDTDSVEKFRIRQQIGARGLSGGAIFIFKNYRELFQKLRVAIGERLSGNNSKRLKNTIWSFIDFLLKNKKLSSKEHKAIVKRARLI